MRVLDTHQHIWEMERLSYSWCRRIPKLNRSFTSDDYRQAAEASEIERTIFVEADVDEPFMLDETRYALALAALPGELARPVSGVVASVRPESPDCSRYLESIVGNEKLKGVRRVLHTEPDELSCGDQFRDNVRSLANYDLSFDICVLARQLPVAIRLVDNCSQVAFILDHAGNPLIREGDLDEWRTDLLELSLRPNVTCKISGLVTRADHGRWTADDLRPVVDHALECFGWERVMFGSDWPVCNLASSLQRWLDVLTEVTNVYGQKNQQRLFYDNAARIYRIGHAGDHPTGPAPDKHAESAA